MSRIRSIHPGLWTDEEFVTLSAYARLLLIGLWNECDDKGIFEWKPLTLKMRLLPADNVDASELLAEIEKSGAIKLYSIDGKQFGAVRNFAKFQRPKKPNDIHPATAEILAFCAVSSELQAIQGEQVPNQFPTASEIAPQMEDGGGREGGEENKKVYAFEGRFVRLNPKDHAAWHRQFHAIADLNAELATLDTWLARQPEPKQRDWFITGASWLNRRHQETLSKSKTDPAPAIGI